MRRREFITLLGGAAAWPLAARAQQPERMRRIGVLVGFAESDPQSPVFLAAFRHSLERLGWKEGLNIRIEYRWGAGDPTRMRAHAKELIGTSPDILVAESTPATASLQAETRTTPIVFLQAGNPVGSGFVASIARPSRNLTGFTNYAPTMGGKWLELLKEVAPRLVRTAALFNPKTHTGQYWSVLEAGAQTVNVTFAKAAVAEAAEIERAVAAMSGEPSGGLLVMPDFVHDEPSGSDRGFGGSARRAGDLCLSGVPRERRADVLRHGHDLGVSRRCGLCRPHPSRRKAG